MLVLDAAPGLKSASVGIASARSDGSRHLELIDHRPGYGWLVESVAAVWRADRPSKVAVVAGSPVEAVVPDLEALGVVVERVSLREFAASCGSLVGGVRDRSVWHRSGQFDRVVSDAVGGAVRKPSGDGGFVWSRSLSPVDVSPLVVLTVAHHLVPQRDEGEEESSLW